MTADSPAPRMVAVTGATGRQGSAVARHLLAGGVRVRALTRSPGGVRARALRDLGAEVMRCDMEHRETLDAAFAGADGVFCVQNPMTSSIEREILQGRNVAEAAADAGISHLVYGAAGTGQRGTGIPSWESKLVIEDRMHQLGLPITVLRPMAFMELMTDRGFYPNVTTWHLMPKLMGEQRPVGWLCTDDLGAVSVRVFAEPGRYVGQDLRLASDVQTIEACRAIWRRVIGRSPRALPVPVRLFERFVGPDLTTMWRWLRTARFDMGVERTRSILPAAATVEEWLNRQVASARISGRRGSSSSRR